MLSRSKHIVLSKERALEMLRDTTVSEAIAIANAMSSFASELLAHPIIRQEFWGQLGIIAVFKNQKFKTRADFETFINDFK